MYLKKIPIIDAVEIEPEPIWLQAVPYDYKAPKKTKVTLEPELEKESLTESEETLDPKIQSGEVKAPGETETKTKKKSLIRSILSTKTVAMTLLTTACFSKVLTLSMNYIENHFGARTGWRVNAECEVADVGNKKYYRYSKKNLGTSNPAAVFAACARVFYRPGFIMGSANMNFGKSIYGVEGGSGELNTQIMGYGMNYEAAQSEEARTRFEDIQFYALENQERWIGNAGNLDWFIYQAMRGEHAITEYVKSKTPDTYEVFSNISVAGKYAEGWIEDKTGKAIASIANIFATLSSANVSTLPSPLPQENAPQISSSPRVQSPQ